MKKLLFIVLSISMALSACLPGFGGQAENDTQAQVDVQGTAVAVGSTIAAETLSPLASPQLFIPITDTLSPSETPMVVTLTETIAATISATVTLTNTPAVLPSGSGTPGLTEISVLLTGLAAVSPTGSLPATSGTPVAKLTGSPTFTETAQALSYGTLPPSVPSGTITLVNKAQADVYVSLQVELADGSTTILEFPVNQTIKTKAPAGSYFFNAWVGGKQMTGSFNLPKNGGIKLTFNKKNVDVTSY